MSNRIFNITNENNQIVIIYENNEIIFELEDNMYNRYEICEYLNEGFSMHNLNIECTFDELYYSITHKNNKNFTIKNSAKLTSQELRNMIAPL